MVKKYVFLLTLKLVLLKSISQIDQNPVEWTSQFTEVTMKMAEDIEIDPYGPPIYLIPSIDTVGIEDTISYDVYFGNEEKEAEDVYGISMEWRHETAEIFGGNNTASFDGCWLGTDGVDMISLHVTKDDGIDIAMSRTNQINRSGKGYLATIDIVTPDNLVEKVNDIEIKLTDVSIVSYNGDTLIPNYIEPDKVILVSREKVKNRRFFTLSPNPSNGVFKLQSSSKINHLEVVDLTGRVVYELPGVNNRETINLKVLPKGIYILKAYSCQGLLNRQIHLK